ncbi:MAG: hydrogenase iron-sulfur subunit [Pseudomonadales bacterium]|nr:hydrogenase iron-sulfur subunit [Halioglobus sp.]MCP5120898.1 hydrogenase iron-sulfur subunit [Pseudomonadales bacterium]MCP5194340.1 hydrogenase iron-sulfur subunit [Pseudomonadales bacterium]
MKTLLKKGFNQLDSLFSKVFTPAWNPMYQLGALAFFYFWVVAVTGVYLFIFFETSISGAYSSIEQITVGQWYLGGVMRSFHRYASAAMGITVTLHLLREFALDRYSGPRWFSWVSGIPLLWLLFASAIGGYWLVWDQQAQYIAVLTAEWFDWLPIMVDPMASNFLNESTLSDRFFSLLVFLHIGIPLALLLGMFIHIKRVTAARSNPAKGLAAGTLLALLAISLWQPALSQAPANLDVAVTKVGLDWIFLNPYPLINSWGPGQTWALLVGLSTLLTVLPWLPSRRPKQTPVAMVYPPDCNGCGWCLADCPYEAISMKEHDYKPGHKQSVVDPDLCVSCGICAGACPSSSPFRHVDELTTGISIPGLHIKELLSLTETKLRELDVGVPRIMLYGCDHGSVVEGMQSNNVATISMPCSALVPPAFVDYVLRQDLAEGVLISGCCEGDCYHRLGNTWMDQRFAMERMPMLRTRVPRERVRLRWLGAQGTRELGRELIDFQQQLAENSADVDLLQLQEVGND